MSLKVDQANGVHRLTLSRPDAGNSLSAALVEALHAALDDADGSGARALVLEGEGPNFCTGFDLSGVADASDADLLLRFIRIEQLLARVWSAPYATIALAQGRTFGAGADLFVACARRIVVDGADFSFPGAAFGLVLGTRRLAQRIGQSAASECIMGRAVIGTAEAVAIGLATRACAADQGEQEIEAEVARAFHLDAPTSGAIRAVLAGDSAALDSDLASLVRSAARSGLGARIIAFRERERASRKR